MKRKIFFLIALGALALGLVTATPTSAAPEATFTVNTTKINGFDGVCNGAECAFAEAINAANANAGKDKIKFNIPAAMDPGCTVGTGVCIISLEATAPEITDPVVIDGYSQPGASPNTLVQGLDTQLKIHVEGQRGLFDGLVVSGGNSEIKGLALTDFHFAIVIKSGSNRVRGNFVGVNPDGSIGEFNERGVSIEPENIVVDNQIGGEMAANRNLISGSYYIGIFVSASTLTKVQGNYIGTDTSGLTDLGNPSIGIWVTNSSAVSIGGLNNGAGNVISGNDSSGMTIEDGTLSSKIIGNYIGVGADGKTELGNQGGIYITGKVKNLHLITNIIANNALVGVSIGGAETKNIYLTRNSIYNNFGELGIDLYTGVSGVTSNDLKDVDAGPNHLQNFPVLTLVEPNFLGTTIKGKLNSTPNKTFRIEFFTNPTCDASGHGEGKHYLGIVVVQTNNNGNVNFTFNTPKILLAGTQVTANATSTAGDGTPLNTSEFSKCKAAE